MRVDASGWLEGVPRQESPDRGGACVPEVVVMHYTGSGSAKGSADWLSRRDEVYVSAHVVVGRAGEVTQLVPFTAVAYHAGRSAWAGRTGVNAFSAGIELVNWGLLTRDGGEVRSSTGQRVSLINDAQYAPHKSEPGVYRWWQRYPAAQVVAAARVVAAVMDAYPSVAGVVGHEDVSPGRKVDPGPAFPWDDFTPLVASLRGP